MTHLKSTILLLLLVFLASCSGNENNLIDGDKQVTDEMNTVISDYIIQRNSSSYAETDKQFEVHKIYGTSEEDGVISVYMWSYYGGYNQATGMEIQSGHSLPAVIRLSKKEESYTVTDYQEPKDGTMYESSLKKIFPKKYLKYTQRDAGNIDDLQKKMDAKVKQWLH